MMIIEIKILGALAPALYRKIAGTDDGRLEEALNDVIRKYFPESL